MGADISLLKKGANENEMLVVTKMLSNFLKLVEKNESLLNLLIKNIF